MSKRCPHCRSYGVFKKRRRLWRRLARRPHTYSCIDCGATFSRHDALVPASTREALPAPGLAPDIVQRVRRLTMRVVRSWFLGHGPQARGWLGSLRHLRWRAPIEVWVIKQIDDDILHLCGIGTLHSEQRHRDVIEALKRGSYHGGVRLGQTGIVLNSRLFTALIPLDALCIEPSTRARWQGRSWQLSHVPQRCWQHEGRLVAHLGPVGDRAGLISCEDVSTLLEGVAPDAVATGIVVFESGAAPGDPLPSMDEFRARRARGDAGRSEELAMGRRWKPPKGGDPS
ncbi:hypothetical protein [Halomonas heilongjiangensis]|uniref:Uncharacterized protein n=1 Tax=Halomonas heilongjiangensis TaxID=1387883 RepID=A0A2N7TR58_9GAMM|nr:hypothetical protein [Halomonas heilongjiangensis]PMR70676.1 hypothetical protein C1H66_05190 [Halomonas heilongjiangensis]PXX88769.1 hypothetical protein CR158_11980 [Halomonas heilongjiangensis]